MDTVMIVNYINLNVLYLPSPANSFSLTSVDSRASFNIAHVGRGSVHLNHSLIISIKHAAG